MIKNQLALQQNNTTLVYENIRIKWLIYLFLLLFLH